MTKPHEHQPELAQPERRTFLHVLAGTLGAMAAAFPFLAGLGVLLDPLRRKVEDTGLIRVGSLDALPEDGSPVKFPVLMDKKDAWNKFSKVPVGAVYVRRLANNEFQAFNVVCPHAGCYVDFMPGRGSFLCPCHNSTFAIDGKINDPNSPSPRGLDPLEVEVRNGKEVWVKFQNFQTGRADRVVVA